MRGGRLISGCALVVAATVTQSPMQPAGQVAAVSASTPLPPYIEPHLNFFSLYANNEWKVGNTGVGAAMFNGTPTPYNAYLLPGGEPARYMWAHSCTRAAQTVDFLRNVWLPGVPETAQFYALQSVISEHGHYWSDAFQRIKLIVNDKVVSNTTSNVYLSTAGSAFRQAFRPGINRIQLIVVKRANPSAISTCGASKAHPPLGISLQLVGSEFPTDLGFDAETEAMKIKYVHVQPGASIPFYYSFKVHNFGPSYARNGYFRFQLQPGPTMQISYPLASLTAAPFHSCTITAGTIVECSYDDNWLPPGGTANLTAYWKLDAPSGACNACAAQSTLNWSVGAPNAQTDPQPANNTGQQIVYFCWPGATMYDCDKN